MNAVKALSDLDSHLAQLREDVRRGKVANTALGWLEEYGARSATEFPGLEVDIAAPFATACSGYSEAIQFLDAAGKELGDAIVARAIENAKAAVAKALSASAAVPQQHNPN